ncbi:two-component sensor histidine kinase, partial [Streptomyces sp. NPDC059627]
RIFEPPMRARISTGMGVADARDLAEPDGGRLQLLQAQPPVFGLFLSRTPPPHKPDDDLPMVR